MKSPLLFLISAFCLLPSAFCSANDWHQWRGPEQTGVSRETGLPEKFDPDTGENLVWKNNVGGMSSPIVMKGKVYTLTRVGEEEAPGTLVPGHKTQESFVAIDANTGMLLWEYRENITQSEVPFHRLGWSNVVGDPQTGRVYAHMVHASLVCLDGETGKLIWKRQLTEEFGVISTFGGRTSTPAIDEDQIIAHGVAFGFADHARSQHRVFAFDKNTGELRWSNGSGGIAVDAPYNTPSFATINGQRLVILGAGDGGIHAFQSRTGKKVWSYKLSKRGVNSSPLVHGNLVFACSSEESEDNTQMGRVVCLDASVVENEKPKELWRADRIEAGFASPTIWEDRLYVLDNSATVYSIDIKTGKPAWRKKVGTIAKASLVFADGKLYITEANGRFSIMKPSPTKGDFLSRSELSGKLGREYDIFGSVAISNGRIFVQAANNMYCIGPREAKVVNVPIPEQPKEGPADAKAAVIQVRPYDALLKPGQKQSFQAFAFDTNGRAIGEVKDAKWSVGQLTFPPPPSAPQGTPPTKAGNLKGEIAATGEFTAANAGHQAGAVFAEASGVSGQGRVRVLPPLPWKFDFEQAPIDRPPLTWLGAGGKFAVKDDNGNKALVKLLDLDLYYRARTNFGDVHMSNYTLTADVKAASKEIGGALYIPDPGVINSRYVMNLLGNHQRLQIHTWPSTLPYSLNKTIPFEWKPNTWYRMKLRVDQLPDKAIARGKVWPAESAEPAEWNIELEDTLPNRNGNPGLFGHSLTGEQKSFIYYDNIEVTENK